MLLVKLVVVACLIAVPSGCRAEQDGFSNESGIRGCMERALPLLATWRRHEPGRTVQDRRCEPVELDESEA